MPTKDVPISIVIRTAVDRTVALEMINAKLEAFTEHDTMAPMNKPSELVAMAAAAMCPTDSDLHRRFAEHLMRVSTLLKGLESGPNETLQRTLDRFLAHVEGRDQ